MPCVIVPEGDGAIVAAAEEHVVLVDSQRVDDGVVAAHVVEKHAVTCLQYARKCGGQPIRRRSTQGLAVEMWHTLGQNLAVLEA